MTKELLQQALECLIEVVSHAQHLTCTHDNTHRGGAIWKICEDCGSQWADDRGGKPPYKEWPAITAAKATIVAIQAAIAQPVQPEGDAKDAIPAGVLTAIRLAGLTLIQNQRGYRLEKFSDLVAQNNPICGNCDTPYPPGCKGQFKDDGDICMASGAAIASQKGS